MHPQGWKRSPNPYSYAIRSGDTLFLAGLVSRNGADNAFVAGDVRVQTRTIMENARELLEAAGMTLANIVSARVYLTNAADFAAMNEVYGCFLSAPPAGHRAMRPRRAGSRRGNHVHRVCRAAARLSGCRRRGCRSARR